MSEIVVNPRGITQLLCHRLSQVKPGEVITYRELTDYVNLDIFKKSRHLLTSATKIVQREKEILFKCIHGVGLQRMIDTESVTPITQTTFAKIRRNAQRGQAKLECINYFSLNKHEQVALNTSQAMLSTVQFCCTQKTFDAVQAKMSGDSLPKANLSLVLSATVQSFEEQRIS